YRLILLKNSDRIWKEVFRQCWGGRPKDDPQEECQFCHVQEAPDRKRDYCQMVLYSTNGRLSILTHLIILLVSICITVVLL
ncbi:MAG: hypothetical protein ACRD8W_29280, partial [Nitrososphaeraceae archaeon]